MTDPTPAEALKAEEVVDALFADLRDRKFLKYLFAEDPENHGAYGYIERPFDLDVQQEIADTWRAIVTAGLAPPPPDAGEVRTYRDGVEDAARVCAEWSTMLSMRVDDLIRIRASQRTVKAIREAANQLLNAESAIRKLP